MKTLNKVSPVFLLFFLFSWQLSAQCIDVDASIADCSDVDNNFFVSVSVTNPGPGTGASFLLGGNGNTYGSFAYSASPIILGPFQNNGTTYEFVAIDNTLLTCTGEDVIAPFGECPIDCLIEINSVQFQLCDADENRYLDFQVAHNSNVGEDFVVLVNGEIYDTLSYATNFYTIGPLTDDCSGNINLGIFDIFHPGCVDFYFQAGPFCCPDNCEIDDVQLNTYCVNDEITGIIMDFTYNGSANEQFEILYDSFAIDTVTVAELPDTFFYNFIGLVPDSIALTFGAEHISKPDCGFSESYIATCFTAPPCQFSNVNISPISCESDTEYSLGLDFQAISNTSIYFDLYINDEYMGAQQYADLPIVVNEVPGNGDTPDLMEICDNGNASCCTQIQFLGLDCTAPPCLFDTVITEAHECDADGNFLVDIAFDVVNPGDQGFIIRGNGIVYDTFEYNQDFYTIGPLAGDCTTLYEFVVIDLENPDCLIDTGFDEPICCEQECDINEIGVTEVECNGNNLSFFIDFEYVGVTNDFFDLFLGDELIGFYAYEDLPILVNNIPSNDAGFYELTVCDNDNPDCCESFGFPGPVCEGECNYWDFEIDEFTCDTGVVSTYIHFEFEGVVGDFFDLTVNDEFNGVFAYDSLPAFVTGIVGSLIGFYDFTICDNDNPDCCETFTIAGATCDNGPCSITNLFAETRPCDDEGTFEIDFEFDYANNASSSFTVFGDGNNYGSFEYGETFYTIGPFDGDCESNYELIVIDNDDSDCSSEFIFVEALCCEQSDSCEINDLSVNAIECFNENSYFINIDFNFSGTTNSSFDVIADGQNIGFFEFADLPVELIYPGSGEVTDIVTICENDNPDCCATLEFEALNCMPVGDCGIFDVSATPQDCDEDGFFEVLIDFDYIDASDSFSIVGNGQNYGDFAYGESFFIIGPIEGDCETIYEFIVADSQDPNCSDFTAFEEPICCEEDPCAIENLGYEIFCDQAEETFIISLSFTPGEGNSSLFEVGGNGTDYGTFAYGNGNYNLGPLPADGTTEYEFILTDVENENCTAFIEVGTVECIADAVEDLEPNDVHVYYAYDDIICDNIYRKEIQRLHIYNIDGKRLQTHEIMSNAPLIRVNGDNLMAGLYVVNLELKEGQISKKIFIK